MRFFVCQNQAAILQDTFCERCSVRSDCKQRKKKLTAYDDIKDAREEFDEFLVSKDATMKHAIVYHDMKLNKTFFD